MANEYEKALSHAKAGRLETAQQILISLEDERSEKLLAKVNKAIAARGASAQAVAEGMKQDEQRIAKRGGKLITYGCLWYFVIAGACIGGLILWGAMQDNKAPARIQAADMYCHAVFAIESIGMERETFNEVCRRTAQDTAATQKTEIDYCLSISSNGERFQALYDCMVEQNVYVSRQYFDAAK